MLHRTEKLHTPIVLLTEAKKILLFGTDADGQIHYTVKQDGFEDSYLNESADQRTGWEDWKKLEFPNEKKDDQSVVDLVNNLYQGWFSVVLVPTFENDVYHWHIFAYNSETRKVELTTIRASGEGLFDIRDSTILEESNDRLVPRPIPG